MPDNQEAIPSTATRPDVPSTNGVDPGSAGSAAEAPRDGASWNRLRWSQRLPLILAVMLLAALAIPALPPGVCFSDSGDFQLASVTLGIMHPPGYPGYVSLGYLLTRIPGVEPAYLVTLGSLAAGIVALALLALLAVRLGMNAWLAAALAIFVTADPHFWNHLVAPEVYTPSIAFLLGAVYLLIKYAHLGRRRDLYWAAFCFGCVVANRPTAVYAFPFFALAWLLARRTWERSWRPSLRTFGIAALVAAVPGVHAIGHLWVRDVKSTEYNYIEFNNREHRYLPESDQGPAAKADRLLWHVTAREFKRYMGNDERGAYLRLRWMFNQFFLYRIAEPFGVSILIGPLTALLVAPILIVGAAWTYRRSPPAFWLLFGLIFANAVFIVTYRIYGQAADLTPTIFAGGFFLFAAVAPFFDANGPVGRWAAVIFMVVLCAGTAIDAPRRGPREGQDATAFLRDIDMATLPPDAAICSTWRESTALWYAKYVQTRRLDVIILNSSPSRWVEMIERYPDRPHFAISDIPELAAYRPTPFRRQLWKLRRPATSDSATSSGP